MNKTAIYPGSFDPFTNGHLDVVLKASKLFEKVHIVIGLNVNKKRTYNEIESITKASTATISRINKCLHYGADGYQRILKRMEEQETE